MCFFSLSMLRFHLRSSHYWHWIAMPRCCWARPYSFSIVVQATPTNELNGRVGVYTYNLNVRSNLVTTRGLPYYAALRTNHRHRHWSYSACAGPSPPPSSDALIIASVVEGRYLLLMQRVPLTDDDQRGRWCWRRTRWERHGSKRSDGEILGFMISRFHVRGWAVEFGVVRIYGDFFFEP